MSTISSILAILLDGTTTPEFCLLPFRLQRHARTFRVFRRRAALGIGVNPCRKHQIPAVIVAFG